MHTLDAEELVRRVESLVRRGEREEHGVDAEQAFEELAYRKCRAHAHAERLLSVDLLQHAFGRHETGMVREDAVWPRRVPLPAERQAHAGWHVRFEVPRDERADPVRILVGTEAAAELRVGFIRRDCLAP